MFNESYQKRIGTPTTDDEVRGHMIFATGLLAGIVGIALFLFSSSATATREIAILASAGGLALMVAGPVVRLPLRRLATSLVVTGLVACAAAMVWFSMVFPQAWTIATGNQGVILLYGAGISLMAVGGVFVPLLSTKTKGTATRQRTGRARNVPPQEPEETAPPKTDTDQARRDRQAEQRETERKRTDAERDRLQAALAGARGDEADLAAELAALRKSESRFEIVEGDDGKWHWRLRHMEGDTLADDGGADYGRRHDAQEGVARVRREALGAAIVHMEAEEAPSPSAAFEPATTPGASSDATFEVYEGSSGDWRWRLRHENGKVLADGGESFASKANARRAIVPVQETAGPADTLEFDPTAFQVYRDLEGRWRWRLVHRNGNILADSGQGYSRRHDANRAVERLQDDPSSLEVEVYEDKAGEHRWRMTAQNGRIIADSGEGYENRSNARRAVDRLGKHVANADTLEIGLAAFEVVEHDGGGHQWRLRHRNGNVLARGADEGFPTRSGAREGIASVKRNAPGADFAEA